MHPPCTAAMVGIGKCLRPSRALAYTSTCGRKVAAGRPGQSRISPPRQKSAPLPRMIRTRALLVATCSMAPSSSVLMAKLIRLPPGWSSVTRATGPSISRRANGMAISVGAGYPIRGAHACHSKGICLHQRCDVSITRPNRPYRANFARQFLPTPANRRRMAQQTCRRCWHIRCTTGFEWLKSPFLMTFRKSTDQQRSAQHAAKPSSAHRTGFVRWHKVCDDAFRQRRSGVSHHSVLHLLPVHDANRGPDDDGGLGPVRDRHRRASAQPRSAPSRSPTSRC